jgi:hypothetical protein
MDETVQKKRIRYRGEYWIVARGGQGLHQLGSSLGKIAGDGYLQRCSCCSSDMLIILTLTVRLLL